MKHDSLCLLVYAPYFSVLPDFEYDWEASAHEIKVYEEISVYALASFVSM